MLRGNKNRESAIGIPQILFQNWANIGAAEGLQSVARISRWCQRISKRPLLFTCNRRDEGSDDQTYAKAGDQAADKCQRRSGKKKEAYAQS